MNMATKTVRVVGGGFAGLAAATALARYGWTVVLHERGPEIRAFGSALALSENGLKVLEMLGAYEDAVRGAFPLFNRETRDGQGRLLSSYNWKTEDQTLRMFMLLRSRVIAALETAARKAGVTIVTSSLITEVEDDGTVTLEQGARLKADLVVIADGANSNSGVRQRLFKRRKVFADGSIRMLIPRENADDWSDGTFVEYWSGRRRAMLSPCSEKHLYLGLIAQEGDKYGTKAPIDKVSWIASFPVLEKYIERVGAQDRWSWDQYQSIILTGWHARRVAILGDAAHAMSPNFGQGAALAMVNAVSLAVKVSGSSNIEAALAAWETNERPLVDKTQLLSGVYSSLMNWPATARNTALAWMGRSRWIMKQRTLAAYKTPVGYAPEKEEQNAV